MKSLYVLIILVLISPFYFSQSEEISVLDHNKWTVRSYLFSQPYTYDRIDPLPEFFTGIGIKRNLDKISLRFSYEYMNYNYDIENPKYVGHKYRVGGNSEHGLRIGAEYRRVYEGRISINLFVDFLYANYTNNQLFSDSANRPVLLTKIKGNSYGGIVGIGVDYFLTPKISVAFESRLDLLHYDLEVQKLEYLKNFSVNYQTDSDDINLRLVGNFSLNYHF